MNILQDCRNLLWLYAKAHLPLPKLSIWCEDFTQLGFSERVINSGSVGVHIPLRNLNFNMIEIKMLKINNFKGIRVMVEFEE